MSIKQAILIIPLTLMLLGCSTPSVTEYVEVPVHLPSSLIHHPCDPIGVGNTVDSLTRAYIDNTICIGKYKSVVTSIDEYNNKIKSLKKSIEKEDDMVQ